MFRRGMPFRPPIDFLRILNPMLQRILGEANQAFEAGDYSQAADRYTRLAQRAMIRGKARAGNWLIKAGQANTLSGKKESGMKQILQGMEILRTQGRQRDLGKYAWRTIDLFEKNGLKAEAKKISDWIQGTAPDVNITDINNSIRPDPSSARQKLPSKCPSCGAPVHPQTVDWVDNGQAACAYCGILLPEG
jgi:hypothetical protein